MTPDVAEALFSMIDVDSPPDDATTSRLVEAMWTARSSHLARLLGLARAAAVFNPSALEGAAELLKEAAASEPHLFYSEALERAVIASVLDSGRRRGDPLYDDLFRLSETSQRAARRFSDLEGAFSVEDIDRICRARTLATQDIVGNNTMVSLWPRLAPAFRMPADVTADPSRVALYTALVARLERTEAQTRLNKEREAAAQALPPSQRGSALAAARAKERFFKERDYALLEELRQAAGIASPSAALAGRNAEQASIDARRDALFAGIAPVWRETFLWLLDVAGSDDPALRALPRDRHVESLLALDEAARGLVLRDIARLRRDYPDWKAGGTPNPDRLDAFARTAPGSMRIDRVPFSAWNKLEVIASLLAARPAMLDDASMAQLLQAAQTWRPLCHLALLDSAELTLQAGPAPLTIQTLAALIARPSHAIVPGRAGARFEGDEWINRAPPRATTLIQRYAT